MRSMPAFVFLCLMSIAALSAKAQDSGYTWMVDHTRVVLDMDGFWTATYERERKALDAQAARNGGRFDLTYNASMERLEIVEAATVKADGRRVAVTTDKIIDIAPSVSREAAFYTDQRTRSIVFPEMEAGDSIRFVYRRIAFDRAVPGFHWNEYLRNSVRDKSFVIVFDHPKELRLFAEYEGVNYLEEEVGDRVVQTFSWSNDKSVPEEAGSTSAYDWAPHYLVSSFRSYAEMGDYYARLHTAAAAVTPEVAALAERITAATSDRREQARLLFEWVTKNIRYVGVLVGAGKMTPTSAEETIRNRYGDCKASGALLSALLAAKGIASEPALMNIDVARYRLPKIFGSIFDHVILFLPDMDAYVDPTAHHAAFGVLPWGHYDKPVLLAVEGKSRTTRLPKAHTEDHVVEAHTSATVGTDGRIVGTTHEKATGAFAITLKREISSDLSAVTAANWLRLDGSPGTGKWAKKTPDGSAPIVELTGEFSLNDDIDLAGGEPLLPPAGLRGIVRPGAFLLGTHDTVRSHPFPCFAGRQIETIEVKVPAGFQPTRLPADRHWKISIAEYVSNYAFRDGKLLVQRQFTAFPNGQVCTTDQSKELVGLQSSIRRDYRSVVVFDKPL